MILFVRHVFFFFAKRQPFMVLISHCHFSRRCSCFTRVMHRKVTPPWPGNSWRQCCVGIVRRNNGGVICGKATAVILFRVCASLTVLPVFRSMLGRGELLFLVLVVCILVYKRVNRKYSLWFMWCYSLISSSYISVFFLYSFIHPLIFLQSECKILRKWWCQYWFHMGDGEGEEWHFGMTWKEERLIPDLRNSDLKYTIHTIFSAVIYRFSYWVGFRHFHAPVTPWCWNSAGK